LYRPRRSEPLRAYLKVIFMGFRGPEALKDNLQDRGDCQNTRKSYKTSQFVGWVVGWESGGVALPYVFLAVHYM
jgi:hypothetical protein